MRKFLSVLLALAMMSVVAIAPVSAVTSNYTVRIENSASTVAAGDKLEVVVTVDGVASGVELSVIEFNLTFDSTYLEPVYSQSETGDDTRFTVTPSNSEWDHIISNKGDSFYCLLNPVDDGRNGASVSSSAVSSGDKLSFTLIFNVLKSAAGQSLTVGIADLVAYDATDLSLSSPLSGTAQSYSFSAAVPSKPIANIGAQINTLKPAIRLGAKYDADYLGSISASSIKGVGILLCDTETLGSAELTTSTEGAQMLSATILDYDAGMTYADYSEFIFYVTIRNIPADQMDKEYSYRAYINTSSETILADSTCTRSYQYVYDVLFPSIGTAPGDNVVYPGTGWFE